MIIQRLSNQRTHVSHAEVGRPRQHYEIIKQHNENQNKRYQRKFKSTLNKNRTANGKQQQQKLNDKIPKAAN